MTFSDSEMTFAGKVSNEIKIKITRMVGEETAWTDRACPHMYIEMIMKQQLVCRYLFVS